MKNHYYSKIALIIILTFVSVGESQAGAGAPQNDNFANATPIVVSDGSGSVATFNTNSTKEAGEPDHADNLGGRSVWFKFTPAATGVFRLNTTDTTFDTLLAVYTGNSVNDLTVVSYNDNGNSNIAFGGASTVDLMLVGGITYYIAVDGLYSPGYDPGQGNFKIAILEFPAPTQDDFISAYDLGVGYKGGIAGTNFNATAQVGEPIAQASAGPNRKTVWYRWKSNDDFSVAFEMKENFQAQIGVYESEIGSPTLGDLEQVATNVDYASFSDNRSKTIFFARQNHTYYIQVEAHILGSTQNQVGNFQLKYGPSAFRYSGVLDSYGHRASVMVFRPTDGTWYALSSLINQSPYARPWGMNGDVAIAADFRGNGYSQTAAIRNENGQKMWYIGNGGASFQAIPWGLPTDKPVVGDFDRDGKADVGVIRNSPNGYLWYIRKSDTGSMSVSNFGTTGDRPVLGDFDGDRLTEVTVVRNTQSGLMWYMLKSDFEGQQGEYTTFAAIQFGTASDMPAAEDFDGDGKTDVAVFRPSNGTWYILRSSDGQVQSTQFGMAGDKPQPGDYDGDEKADIAVYRPSTGAWYFLKSSTGTQQGVYWGQPNDIPVSSLSTLSH